MRIDYGLTIPPIRRSAWQFDRLQPGESFDVQPGDANRARNAATAYKRRHPGWSYITRTMPDGNVRFWRTA